MCGKGRGGFGRYGRFPWLSCVFALAWVPCLGSLNLSVGCGTQAKAKPELDRGLGRDLAAGLLSLVSSYRPLFSQGEFWPETETQA